MRQQLRAALERGGEQLLDKFDRTVGGGGALGDRVTAAAEALDAFRVAQRELSALAARRTEVAAARRSGSGAGGDDGAGGGAPLDGRAHRGSLLLEAWGQSALGAGGAAVISEAQRQHRELASSSAASEAAASYDALIIQPLAHEPGLVSLALASIARGRRSRGLLALSAAQRPHDIVSRLESAAATATTPAALPRCRHTPWGLSELVLALASTGEPTVALRALAAAERLGLCTHKEAYSHAVRGALASLGRAARGDELIALFERSLRQGLPANSYTLAALCSAALSVDTAAEVAGGLAAGRSAFNQSSAVSPSARGSSDEALVASCTIEGAGDLSSSGLTRAALAHVMALRSQWPSVLSAQSVRSALRLCARHGEAEPAEALLNFALGGRGGRGTHGGRGGTHGALDPVLSEREAQRALGLALTACALANDAQRAVDAYSLATRAGVPETPQARRQLLHALARDADRGGPRRALALFETLLGEWREAAPDMSAERDRGIRGGLNAALNACARSGDAALTLSIYRTAAAEGVPVDLVTGTTLLLSCLRDRRRGHQLAHEAVAAFGEIVAVVGASGEGQGARLDSQARWTLSRLAEKLADCEGAEWVAAECIALAELR